MSLAEAPSSFYEESRREQESGFSAGSSEQWPPPAYGGDATPDFFSPERRSGGRTTTKLFEDDNPDFLPPKAPERVREGEMGEGRYGDAGGGRTEGFFAGLMEAPDRLRASDLNELLQPEHLDRLRFTNFPLQQYGALFKWETLVDNVIDIYRSPWQTVATEHGLRMPDDDEVLRAVGMRPERAIMSFRWSDDWGETQKLAFEHYHATQDSLAAHDFSASDGVVEWLELLKTYQVPQVLCAGSTLTKPAAEAVLEGAGLSQYFDSIVSLEDGCETAEQTYLVGAIKARRPPEQCVVFEDEPSGVVAAHDATSKVVAIVGGNPNGADLRFADMRVSGMDDLSLMSLRDLFKGLGPR